MQSWLAAGRWGKIRSTRKEKRWKQCQRMPQWRCFLSVFWQSATVGKFAYYLQLRCFSNFSFVYFTFFCMLEIYSFMFPLLHSVFQNYGFCTQFSARMKGKVFNNVCHSDATIIIIEKKVFEAKLMRESITNLIVKDILWQVKPKRNSRLLHKSGWIVKSHAKLTKWCTGMLLAPSGLYLVERYYFRHDVKKETVEILID